MPRKGWKSITVREGVHKVILKIAEIEDKSVGEVVAEAFLDDDYLKELFGNEKEKLELITFKEALRE